MSEIFEREEKVKGKKQKSSRNFGEFVEFLSKSHEHQMEIRRKEMQLLHEKKLNTQQRQQTIMVKMMEIKIKMMEKFFEKDI